MCEYVLYLNRGYTCLPRIKFDTSDKFCFDLLLTLLCVSFPYCCNMCLLVVKLISSKVAFNRTKQTPLLDEMTSF